MRYILFLIPLALLGACTTMTHYGYAPASVADESISATEHGAVFPVTLGEGKGSVRVMSLGIVDLKSALKPLHCAALHLRMIVSHQDGKSPWKINTRAQKIKIAGKGESIPSHVKSNSAHLPEMQIPAGETRQLELFYPLPADEETADKFGGFDFRFRLTAGSEESERTIAFVRHRKGRIVKPVYVNAPYQQQLMNFDEEDMSPQIWWSDPTFSGLGFPGVAALPPMW